MASTLGGLTGRLGAESVWPRRGADPRRRRSDGEEFVGPRRCPRPIASSRTLLGCRRTPLTPSMAPSGGARMGWMAADLPHMPPTTAAPNSSVLWFSGQRNRDKERLGLLSNGLGEEEG
jgi:hypothetical protein